MVLGTLEKRRKEIIIVICDIKCYIVNTIKVSDMFNLKIHLQIHNI